MHPPPLLGIAATHRNSMFDPLLLLLASFVRPQESAAYRGFSSGAMKAHAPNFFGLYDLSHVERKTAAHIRATFAANERSRSRWEALVLSVIGGVPHYEGKAQPPSAHRAPAPFFAGAEGVVFVPNNHRSLQEGDAALRARRSSAHQNGISSSLMSPATEVVTAVRSALGAFPQRSKAGVLIQPIRSSRCWKPPIRSLMIG